MFQKGQSGNRNGRPVGALNKRTEALRLLIDGEGEGLVRKAVEMAKEGDIQALRLCLERILPPVKDAALCLDHSKLGKTASSVLAFSREIINAVTCGEITPSEGEALIGMVEKYGKAIDLKDLEARIIALEGSAIKK